MVVDGGFLGAGGGWGVLELKHFYAFLSLRESECGLMVTIITSNIVPLQNYGLQRLNLQKKIP